MAAIRSCPFVISGDAALLRQHRNALLGLIVREMLDGFQQLRVFLPHDPVQLRGLHSGLLHLLEGPSGVHALMLPGVSNDRTRSSGLSLSKKRAHLPGTGKAGFIEHVKMLASRVGARVIFPTRKEALERSGVDSGLAKLPGGLGGRGESFDRCSRLFCALADGVKGRCLSGACESLQAVDAVGGVENFFDDLTLGIVEKGRVCWLALWPALHS